LPISSRRTPDRADLQVNLAVATLNRQREGDDRDARQIRQRVLSADPQNCARMTASVSSG